MVRSVWLALIFLIGLGALATVRLAMVKNPVAEREMASAQETVEAGDTEDVVPPKGDKLPVAEVEPIPEKKLVKTIPIIPTVAAPAEPEKAPKLVSRQLRNSFAEKLSRTRHHRHHYYHHRHSHHHGAKKVHRVKHATVSGLSWG